MPGGRGRLTALYNGRSPPYTTYSQTHSHGTTQSDFQTSEPVQAEEAKEGATAKAGRMEQRNAEAPLRPHGLVVSMGITTKSINQRETPMTYTHELLQTLTDRELSLIADLEAELEEKLDEETILDGFFKDGQRRPAPPYAIEN